MYYINVYEDEATRHDTMDEAAREFEDWKEDPSRFRGAFVECLFRGPYGGQLGVWPITDVQMEAALRNINQNVADDNEHVRREIILARTG